jgi:small GTP-binding protein
MRVPIFKTILVGEGGVGKSSLVLRYTEDRFEDDMKMTIGANFASKEVALAGNSMKLMLWDMGGQPRFHDVVGDYFRGTKVAIIVYDTNRFYTLERTRDWIERVKEGVPNCELLLVGNKTDQRGPDSGVSLEEGFAYASQFGADCLEVSAKSGDGVVDMFESVATMIVNKYLS